MAFRVEKAIGILTLIAGAFTASAAEFRYEARHDHLRKGGDGTLVIDDRGVSFQESGKKKSHAWRWAYQDIEQLEMSPRTLRVLSYKDDKWKLGADREYRFDLTSSGSFSDAYEFLKSRLDQRFVAALADGGVDALWRVPVKHLARFGGAQGELLIGRDTVVFAADKKGESRTWRYEDIENVSTSGPFQLTVTTYERAVSHYGDLKGFNFQLKQRLTEDRYNDIWRRVNSAKGLRILSSYRKEETQQ